MYRVRTRKSLIGELGRREVDSPLDGAQWRNWAGERRLDKLEEERPSGSEPPARLRAQQGRRCQKGCGQESGPLILAPRKRRKCFQKINLR